MGTYNTGPDPALPAQSKSPATSRGWGKGLVAERKEHRWETYGLTENSLLVKSDWLFGEGGNCPACCPTLQSAVGFVPCNTLPHFPNSFQRQLIVSLLPAFPLKLGCPPPCSSTYEASNYCFTPFFPVVEQSLLQASASLKIHLLCTALKHIE